MAICTICGREFDEGSYCEPCEKKLLNVPRQRCATCGEIVPSSPADITPRVLAVLRAASELDPIDCEGIPEIRQAIKGVPECDRKRAFAVAVTTYAMRIMQEAERRTMLAVLEEGQYDLPRVLELMGSID